MDKSRIHFFIKVFIAVCLLLLTRCLSTGIALNRTNIEHVSSTKSTAHVGQMVSEEGKIQNTAPPTVTILCFFVCI